MSNTWVLIVLILISSLPVAAAYIWFRAIKYQFSPVKFLFALLAGASAFFPALFLQDLLNFQLSAGVRTVFFYEFFVRIALTEEISRLLLLFIFFLIGSVIKADDSLNSAPTFNTVNRGTAIGLVAGLGFAILENASYAASGMDISKALLRFFPAALHGACGSRIGAAVVLFRTNPVQALLRILTATAIHGVYNMLISTQQSIPSAGAFLIALSALGTSIMIIRGSNSDPAIDKDPENT